MYFNFLLTISPPPPPHEQCWVDLLSKPGGLLSLLQHCFMEEGVCTNTKSQELLHSIVGPFILLAMAPKKHNLGFFHYLCWAKLAPFLNNSVLIMNFNTVFNIQNVQKSLVKCRWALPNTGNKSRYTSNGVQP